ncbi:hypothetical protein F0U44_01085 [Nocardioides humilatus]|uniref:Uncharacterized protein n=1 Tax=Nocardioides humilatus TaxID=2607660 RepID=A0A5B1LKH3_9ACTN|nr:hypothetical protein [Nocardioides humilatus]KAA1420966.1 hypothetical protein F0U44_01085 [Nocardioides humilatus]
MSAPVANREAFGRGLADELLRSAGGDVQAFLRFYDATCARAFALELARARSRGVPSARLQDAAARATEARFVEAWRVAGGHQGSGLSPVAWLLTLPLPAAPVVRERRGAICA